MKRRTLDELRGELELARIAGTDVDVDPVTLRSLIEATEALLEYGGTLVELGQLFEPPREQPAEGLALAVEVARARFVDEWPDAPAPAETARARDELDAALAELDAVSPRSGRIVRRLFGRSS